MAIPPPSATATARASSITSAASAACGNAAAKDGSLGRINPSHRGGGAEPGDGLDVAGDLGGGGHRGVSIGFDEVYI
jgi:hypothetical protein